MTYVPGPLGFPIWLELFSVGATMKALGWVLVWALFNKLNFVFIQCIISRSWLNYLDFTQPCFVSWFEDVNSRSFPGMDKILFHHYLARTLSGNYVDFVVLIVNWVLSIKVISIHILIRISAVHFNGFYYTSYLDWWFASAFCHPGWSLIDIVYLELHWKHLQRHRRWDITVLNLRQFLLKTVWSSDR